MGSMVQVKDTWTIVPVLILMFYLKPEIQTYRTNLIYRCIQLPC